MKVINDKLSGILERLRKNKLDDIDALERAFLIGYYTKRDSDQNMIRALQLINKDEGKEAPIILPRKEVPMFLQIAKTCHEVNKSYCESIGNNSQVSWEESPDWQKESAINGVKFHLDNPNSKPEDFHNNWMKEKKKDGWKYGKEKNVEKKEHPCMVPYNKLPKEQQVKDHLFISVVQSMSDPGQGTGGPTDKEREKDNG